MPLLEARLHAGQVAVTQQFLERTGNEPCGGARGAVRTDPSQRVDVLGIDERHDWMPAREHRRREPQVLGDAAPAGPLAPSEVVEAGHQGGGEGHGRTVAARPRTCSPSEPAWIGSAPCGGIGERPK